VFGSHKVELIPPRLGIPSGQVMLDHPPLLRLLSKVLSKISNERAEPIKTRRQTFSTNKTTPFPGKFDRIFCNGVFHKNGQQGLKVEASVAASITALRPTLVMLVTSGAEDSENVKEPMDVKKTLQVVRNIYAGRHNMEQPIIPCSPTGSTSTPVSRFFR
jgi:hypothetical protein